MNILISSYHHTCVAIEKVLVYYYYYYYLGFTPCKAEQPLLQGMELQEKETQKD